jgi:aminomethyltransferase
VPCFTTRSGYTGEDGYEISIPSAEASRLVRALMANQALSWAGLGARDTLRLEAGLPLHGSDMSPSVTPLEAGLVFGIAASRRPKGAKAGGYPGAQALAAQWGAPARRLLAFTSAEPVPIRAHAPIETASGEWAGEVTSGTVSPSLGHPILMALVKSEFAEGELFAQVRGKRLALNPASLPFVPKRYKR